MPYSSVSKVVERFPKLKKYPEAAQKMFLKVVNAALKEYPDDEGKAIATAWAAINKKYGKRDEDMEYSLTQNAFSCNINEHDGVIDIPTVFTREGVQNGAFKPWNEIKKGASTFKGKPVVLGHPPVNRPVSPTLDKYIGEVTEVEPRDLDRALHGTVRIYTNKAPSWFLNALRNCEMRSGSPGFWRIPDASFGTFDGKSYDTIERNLRFDHFAVGIPKGACSVAEGCGLGFNETHEDVEDMMFLNNLKNEAISRLDKLKELLSDIFTRNQKNDEKEGSDKMEMNEEEKAKLEQKYEKQITDLEQTKKEIESEKAELEKQVEDYKSKEEKTAEEHRKSLIKSITAETEESPEDYEDWDLSHLKHMQEKLGKKTRDKLIEEITEATEEDPETYKHWNIPQLEHLKKRVVKESEKKGTDKSALTPPSGRKGEDEPYEPSMAIAGKKLTVGNLMKPPKPQGE